MKKLLFLLVLLMLPGCAAPAVKSQRQIFAMDTVMTFSVWAADGEPALAELEQEIWQMDSRLSVTRPESAIHAINESGRGELSDSEAAMLARVLEISRSTNGLLDPCMYPVTSLWGFTTGDYRVPGADEIAHALALTGADKLTLSGNAVTLAPGAQMDLGAAAKGWAGQVLADRLAARGDVKAALLYLGGNIQTFGEKPDGTPWRIGIQDPWGGAMAAVAEVRGMQSVVTSGGYQRYFEDSGNRYCHIIDPRTGAPASSGLASVTIIVPDGLRADCLSTALFIMGLEDGAAYWRENRDFEVIWITEDGEIFVTEGLSGAVSDCEFEVVS